MISEWMRVMLEEIARKKAEAEQARVEEQQRAKEHCDAGGRSRTAPPVIQSARFAPGKN
jgi:hypothetical protein